VPVTIFCSSVFRDEECNSWNFIAQDNFAETKLIELSLKYKNNNDVNDELMSITKNLIITHPIHYTISSLIDSTKMLYWESTRIGYVTYPGWLSTIFNFVPVVIFFRIFPALVTFLGLLLSSIYLLKNRNQLNSSFDHNPPQTIIICSIYLMIIPYIALHSLITPVIRYIFPIAPLYLIIIAFCADSLLIRPNRQK